MTSYTRKQFKSFFIAVLLVAVTLSASAAGIAIVYIVQGIPFYAAPCHSLLWC